jgi:hypothetical protein
VVTYASYYQSFPRKTQPDRAPAFRAPCQETGIMAGLLRSRRYSQGTWSLHDQSRQRPTPETRPRIEIEAPTTPSVILSGASASLREADAESKDPYPFNRRLSRPKKDKSVDSHASQSARSMGHPGQLTFPRTFSQATPRAAIQCVYAWVIPPIAHGHRLMNVELAFRSNDSSFRRKRRCPERFPG